MNNIIERHGVSIEVRPDGLFRKAVKGAIGCWNGAPHDMSLDDAIDAMARVWQREQAGTDKSSIKRSIKF